MKLNKKIILPLGTLAVVAAPIAVVVSCSEQTTAEENAKKENETRIKDLLIQKFIVDSNEKALGTDFETNQEKAWNFWASHQLLKKPDFWINKINTLLNSGAIDKEDVIGKKDWINAQDDATIKKPAKVNDIDKNFYPSWTIAKEIIKNNPNLMWGLEINKLLLVQRSLTTTDGKMLQNMYKGKKEKDIPTNLITLDDWKKVIAGKETDLPKDAQIKYFYLIKYLKENTPTFVWKRTFSDPFWGQLYINNLENYKIHDVNTFNTLGTRKEKSLFEEDFVKSSILETTTNMPTTFKVEKLYDYKGITGTGFSKGELDYTEAGLKKRLTDNTSEAGFVDKDGNVQQPADATKGVSMSVDNKTATAEFVMQFLPWFKAMDKDGKAITDVKKVSSANNDKSVFRMDSKLIDPTKKDNLQKLIFTLAMNNSSLFTTAKQWLTKGNNHWIDTGIEDLKTKLKDEGLAK